ncbi:Ada metal-binding domain-containing protein [Fructilactobacillus fructivorans]|uniref:sunset domain-containing protein n=1 Tax=Fructilactobacillus fructivorans TaxID=1614 RepID=UPI000704A61A|nr:Ada metal-binding domain-containing protein [Fructilactobacillus fructivorans]
MNKFKKIALTAGCAVLLLIIPTEISLASGSNQSELIAQEKSLTKQSQQLSQEINQAQDDLNQKHVTIKPVSNQQLVSSHPKKDSNSTPARAVQSSEDKTDANNNQKIIGNRKSHVYHLPSQNNCQMKSKNAVYFNSVADAQAAGYREAKR